MVGRLGPNLRPRQQIQNSRPGAPRSQAHRGARDVSRMDRPDRAEQSDEFIGLLAHEVAQTRKASRFWTFSIVKGTQRLVFRTVARPTRAETEAWLALGRGLHPERWGRVTFVWPEKPFRAVSDV